jgi:PHD/YefM family antitoxin component YafN of YafNO toxin-antitoxin module
MDKETLEDIINIANQIKEIIKQGNVEVSHFEKWYEELMAKYNDQKKALAIIDQAVLKFVLLYKEEKAKEGYAVSSNLPE